MPPAFGGILPGQLHAIRSAVSRATGIPPPALRSAMSDKSVPAMMIAADGGTPPAAEAPPAPPPSSGASAAVPSAPAPRRDRLDPLELLSKIMLPLAIAVASGMFSYVKWTTDQQQTRQRRHGDSIAAVAQQRLAVSQMVNTFVPSLTSEKPSERILALQAIAYSDSALGQALSAAVSQADPDSAVRDAATAVRLAPQFPFLADVEQVFAEAPTARIAATRALISTWKSDTTMVSALLEAAARNPTNADGLFNTITILRSVTPEARDARRQAILQFTDAVPANLTRVRARADTLAQIVQQGR